MLQAREHVEDIELWCLPVFPDNGPGGDLFA